MALASEYLADRLAEDAGGTRYHLDRCVSHGTFPDPPLEFEAYLRPIQLKALRTGHGRRINGDVGPSALLRRGISERAAAKNADDAFSNRCHRSARPLITLIFD